MRHFPCPSVLCIIIVFLGVQAAFLAGCVEVRNGKEPVAIPDQPGGQDRPGPQAGVTGPAAGGATTPAGEKAVAEQAPPAPAKQENEAGSGSAESAFPPVSISHPEPTGPAEAAAYMVVEQFLGQIPFAPDGIPGPYRLRRRGRAYAVLLKPFVIEQDNLRIDCRMLRLTVIPKRDQSRAEVRIGLSRQIDFFLDGQRLAKLIVRQQQIDGVWDSGRKVLHSFSVQLAPLLFQVHDRHSSSTAKIDGLYLTGSERQDGQDRRHAEIAMENIRLEYRNGQGRLQSRIKIQALTGQTVGRVDTDQPASRMAGHLLTLASLVRNPGPEGLCRLQGLLDLLNARGMDGQLYQVRVEGVVAFRADEMRVSTR